MDVKSLFSLEGKKGFITGSTRGIGKTLAQAFIELGADVAILGTNAENAKKGGGGAFKWEIQSYRL